jgi:hypothetical protein
MQLKDKTKENLLLVLLLLLTFGKGFFWSHTVPIFQAPDEQAHYATIQHYAEPEDYKPQSYNFPISKTDHYNYKTQNLSPELKATLKNTDFRKIRYNYRITFPFEENTLENSEEKEIREEELSRFILEYPPWRTKYSPQYYKIASFLENAFSKLSIFERVYIIRLFSVSIMVLLVFISYLCFKELSLNSRESLLLAGALSFQPMLTFITASINVDSILYLGFFLFILGGLKLIKRFSLTACLLIAFGGWLGCQAKPTGYFMVLAALFFFLYLLAVRLNFKNFWKKNFSFKKGFSGKIFLKYTGVIAALSIIVFALLKFYELFKKYFQNWQIFEKLPAQIAEQMEYENMLRRSFSYWGNFGWLDTCLKYHYIIGTWILLSIATVSFILYLKSQYQKRKAGNLEAENRIHQFVFLLFILVGVYCMIYFVNLFHPTVAYQGRYFLPSVIAKFSLLGFGFAYFFQKIMSREQAFFTLLILMLFLNMISLFSFLIPRYYL